MDATILTPRLQLTLVTKAERGSKELDWLHEFRSDEKATWWSIYGRSKTIEDTEKVLKGILPSTADVGEAKTYRIAYLIHELPSSNSDLTSKEHPPKRFIGAITLRSLGTKELSLPEDFFPASTFSHQCLTMELAYGFLPVAWGKGYATEAVNTVLGACGRERKFWDSYEKVFVRALVNDENPASQRVMAKTRMKELGVHTWENKDALWLAGKWRTTHCLRVYGMFVVE